MALRLVIAANLMEGGVKGQVERHPDLDLAGEAKNHGIWKILTLSSPGLFLTFPHSTIASAAQIQALPLVDYLDPLRSVHFHFHSRSPVRLPFHHKSEVL